MRILLAVACLVVVACGGSPSTPSQPGSLRLTGSITRTVIAAGGTATITFELRNSTSNSVTLNFPDTCQLMPYITSSYGLIVYPEGGGWVCATVITSLTLKPGEAKTLDVAVRAAATASYPDVALGPGSYRAYARVPASQNALQSDPIGFTVQ